MCRIRYVHTNLVTDNWKALAQFYIDVFGCEPVYPERDLSGEWVDDLTGIKGARIRGIHLRLPGYGDGGPTLEIFEYAPEDENKVPRRINAKGFGHIAFLVDSVQDVLEKLIAHGGKAIGKVIKREYEGIGLLTAVYATDLDGNSIEIQNWNRSRALPVESSSKRLQWGKKREDDSVNVRRRRLEMKSETTVNRGRSSEAEVLKSANPCLSEGG